MLPLPFELSIHELEIFFLVLVRTLSFFFLVPLFGYATNPPTIKIGLSVTVAFILTPFAGISYSTPPTGLLGFVELVVREVGVGLFLGMATIVLFAGVQFAGELVGIQIGFSVVNLIDPTQETNLSIVGQLNFYVAMMLFLLMDGHHRWLEALAYSYDLIPPGTGSFHFDQLMQHWVGVAGWVFVIALKVAAPIMATLFLTDVALGLLSRSAEQLNIFTIGFSVKLIVGTIAIAFGFPLFAYLFGKIFAELLKQVEHVLPMLAR
ncbi:MAG: flagellar biosynthetic protein FliR [bacterium]|nr:flagellar biosynthetic protein FliR [bacterium]